MTAATKSDNLPAIPSVATGIAILSGGPDEWTDIDAGDYSPAKAGGGIPLLPLNRKLGGGFVDPDTGEVATSLDLVWLAKGTTRAYWPDPFGKGDKSPTCASSDGIVPMPTVASPQSTTCATCPMSRWTEDPPACKESVEAMVFLPDPMGYGRLARVRLGGIAIAPAESYWSSFNARMPPRPPLSVITHVDLEEVDCPPNGKFLSPTFRRVRNLTREEAQPLIDERKRRVAEWRSLVAEDVQSGATREAPTAASPEHGSSPDGTYAAEGFDGEEPF